MTFERKIRINNRDYFLGVELKYIKEAYDTNWMSTDGENIDEIEKEIIKARDLHNKFLEELGLPKLK